MGFTVYYRNDEPVDEFTALRFMKEASAIVEANADWLRDGFDEGDPVFGLDEIWVNGGGETLYLTPERLTSEPIAECVKPCGNEDYRKLLENVFTLAENMLGGTFRTD